MKAPSATKLLDDVPNLNEIILDLLAKNNSPNEVMDHVKTVYNTDLSYYKIRQFASKYGPKIDHINFTLTTKLITQIELVELDETFQGRHSNFLVVIDKPSSYIIAIVYLTSRTSDALIHALQPWKALFARVVTVFTDGANYYPAVLQALCPLAKHQLCLIHVIRQVLGVLNQLRTAWKKSGEELATFQATLTKKQTHLRSIRLKLKHQRADVTNEENKRDIFRGLHQLRPYQKGVNQQFPEMAGFAKTLNALHSSIKSAQTTEKNLLNTGQTLKTQIATATKAKNTAWNEYMQALKDLAQFKALFLPSETEFLPKWTAFLNKLHQSSRKFAQAFYNVLIDRPALITLHTQVEVPSVPFSQLNTNQIESRNNIIRPLLSQLRHCTDTPYLQFRLGLFQLYQNTHRPYSGPRKNSSPLERLGYNLKGRSYLDLLFDGLPPGRQLQLESVVFDSAVS